MPLQNPPRNGKMEEKEPKKRRHPVRIALCIDDYGGMTFNNRRQSRDRILLADLLAEADGRLRIHPFSEKLIPDAAASEDYLAAAGEADLCFVEKDALLPFADRIGELILYRWNRHYPADTYFDLDLGTFRLVETTEFVGSSHEKITKERYKR